MIRPVTLLAISFGLAAANLGLYASFAIPYSERLNGLAVLGLLAAGVAAFALVPWNLANRWILRRRGSASPGASGALIFEPAIHWVRERPCRREAVERGLRHGPPVA